MNEQIIEIPLNDIIVTSNTRTEFDENGLKELAASIKTNGVIEPIIVKENPTGNYRLICGERRYRASLLAGKSDIRAEVRDVPENKILQFQIVENLQRRGLSTMEEVRAIIRLRDEESMTETEIAKAIGKAPSHVAAQLRISRAQPEVHDALNKKQISRSVGLLIAALDSPDKQTKAVHALKRDNIAYQVKANDAEKWIKKMCGAQERRPFRKNGAKKPAPAGKFAADWKYYLLRFSGEQFENWQNSVGYSTETELWASAVEEVMIAGQSNAAKA